MVCAAVNAADDEDLGTLGAALDEKDLRGQALADFKSWQKGMAAEFPSEAYELPVTLKGKTYTFWYVKEENDGGECAGVYRTDGRVVSFFCAGESGNIVWSAPADKCSF
jgi:hypothetical protein